MNSKKSLFLSLALVGGLAISAPVPAVADIRDNSQLQDLSRLVMPGRVIPNLPVILDEEAKAKLVAEVKEKLDKISVPKLVATSSKADEAKGDDNDDSNGSGSSTDSNGTDNSAPGNSNSGTNPALDFDNITEDPDNYRLPAAAEVFKSGNKYQIPAPTDGGKAVGEYDPKLLKYYAQNVTWGSCEPFGYGATRDDPQAGEKVRCAYAILPLDYQKPDGPTIAVGMLKVLSKAGDNKLGTVFTDPGGPGGSGMESAFSKLDDPILENFDLIGFDPRGVGSSLPQLRCESSDAKDKQRQFTDAISGAEADKILEYNTNKCYENTGKIFTGLTGEDFIANVGTANVARDLDVMRSIVGDEKLSYIGFSYGTSIGYVYAQLLPSHIRALILDGQVNPYQNNKELLEKYEGLKILASSSEAPVVSQMRGFNDTFKQFIKSCLKGEVPGFGGLTEADCPLRDGDPIADPSDEQVQSAYAKYQELARLAWNTGHYSSNDGRAVSFADVSQGTILTMYSDNLWRYLKYALTSMQKNKDASFMLRLADFYYDRNPQGKYNFSDASFRSISCTDRWGSYDNREEQVETGKAVYQTAPFLDPGLDENGQQRGLEPSYGWCHYYKVRNQLPKGEELKDVPNVLVISSSYDPATPYQNGVVAGMGLNGTLLSVANKSHCAYGKVDCATNVAVAYLIDPLKFLYDIKADNYEKGNSGVQTRHIYSDKDVTGNECKIDYYGPELKGMESDQEVAEVAQFFNQASLNASGFLAGQEVKFSLADGTELGKATADDQGNAKLSLAQLDSLPTGDAVQILATSSNLTAVLTLKVNPKPEARGVIKDGAATAEITETTPNGQVTIEGYNFIPEKEVEFVLHSNPVSLGKATADTSGKAVLKATIPGDTELGNHEVWLVQDDTTVKLLLTVVAANNQPEEDADQPGAANNDANLPDASSSAVSTKLPAAGVDYTGAGVALLLILGAGVVLATRRED